MCCLFGLIDCRRALTARQKTRLIACLSQESESRGTDAAGIAYNSHGRLCIYKRPGPAHQLRFRIPEDARVVMGHTRLTTQGNANRNRNNHPFSGQVPGTRFALAHNGVLHNDLALRKHRGLPDTKIETDSYIAVQLIEQQGALTPDSLREMAGAVEGSFVFTVLDRADNLYFVRGDNPLCLLRFPRLGLCLYASTETILRQAIARTWLRGERTEHIPTDCGDILRIDRGGDIQRSRFVPPRTNFCGWGGWRACLPSRSAPAEARYLEQLKGVASSMGYAPEQIDRLLGEGWSADEIEDALYSYDYLREEDQPCWC